MRKKRTTWRHQPRQARRSHSNRHARNVRLCELDTPAIIHPPRCPQTRLHHLASLSLARCRCRHQMALQIAVRLVLSGGTAKGACSGPSAGEILALTPPTGPQDHSPGGANRRPPQHSILPPVLLIKQRRKPARSARSVAGLVSGRTSFLPPSRLFIVQHPLHLFILLLDLLSCHAGEPTRVRSDYGNPIATVGCACICCSVGAAAAAARPVDGNTHPPPPAGMPFHELDHRVGGGKLAVRRAGARGATLPLGRPAGIDRTRAAGRRRRR